MRTMQTRTLAAIAIAALAVNVAVQGCAFDDSTDAAKPYHLADGGADGTVGDAALQGETSVQGLCVKVGGYASVQKIGSDTVSAMSNDCRLAGFFASLSADQKQHMVECFQVFLGATFDCASTSYANSKDSKGQACRDMKTTHQNMGISADDFRAFREDTVATMKANNMQTPDVNSVMDLLTGVSGVYNAAKKGNEQCTCPQGSGQCIYVDAGIDTGTDAAKEGGGTIDAAPDTGGGGNDAAAEAAVDAGGGG
jgi:hypothetical protein